MTTNPDIQKEVDYWIKELGTMEDQHCPTLDHKDCGDIAVLLVQLQSILSEKEVELRTIKTELQKAKDRYNAYEELSKIPHTHLFRLVNQEETINVQLKQIAEQQKEIERLKNTVSFERLRQ